MSNNPESGNTVRLRRSAETAEGRRMAADAARQANWKRWGPYLSERQWATVREDYSEHGTCWDYFPHDHARSRAYRWGEDGLLGFSDREGRLCFALALWNGRDPFLKERLFGLTGPEGNHGEDAKEAWFYLDSTPTHSYARALYKYPQAEFPYGRLVAENARAGKGAPEFELQDTGVFDQNRYFDVTAEYTKRSPDDLCIRVTVANRGPEAAELHVLPTLWFRNVWSWGGSTAENRVKPRLELVAPDRIRATHETLGEFIFEFGPTAKNQPPPVWFTENESNATRLWQVPNPQPYVKDAFHAHLVNGQSGVINPANFGTKAAGHYVFKLGPGESRSLRLRLVAANELGGGVKDGPRLTASGPSFNTLFARAIEEADEFYTQAIPAAVTPEARNVMRQGYAGLLWSKQFYHYIVDEWLDGDPAQPAPPKSRLHGRNTEWRHLYARDVISMPDKWEYPWFAAWDLAFHMIPLARIDGTFAKQQLSLFLREWYLHPNGQLPAYEFALGDVNPPVHAWAAWRVYKLTGPRGARDRDFLEGVFQKLLLNFTWWVNRKDSHGKNLFSGGFLGLDNIGVFDRSQALPCGGSLNQADGTAWMAFYCATMLAIALELAHDGDRIRTAYEDMASKFLEHFVQIAEAMNTAGGTGLWDEADGFYYDQFEASGQSMHLKTRSLVGLLPLIAVEVLDETEIARLPGFQRRLKWFTEHKHALTRGIALGRSNSKQRLLLAIPTRQRLQSVLRYLGDEQEFLSPHGLRSVSKYHLEHPYVFKMNGEERRVDYVPGESNTWLFGGNSNWRGPIWFPVNYLIIEALERYHYFYGDAFTVEYPQGSGRQATLLEIARDLQRRLASVFLPDAQGHRPCHGGIGRFAEDPHWRDLVLFHEYFHGETGRGLGADHQTGWTSLVIRCFEAFGQAPKVPEGSRKA